MTAANCPISRVAWSSRRLPPTKQSPWGFGRERAASVRRGLPGERSLQTLCTCDDDYFVYMLNLVDRGLMILLLQPIKEDLQLSDAQLGFLTGIAFGLFYATIGSTSGPLGRPRQPRHNHVFGNRNVGCDDHGMPFRDQLPFNWYSPRIAAAVRRVRLQAHRRYSTGRRLLPPARSAHPRNGNLPHRQSPLGADEFRCGRLVERNLWLAYDLFPDGYSRLDFGGSRQIDDRRAAGGCKPSIYSRERLLPPMRVVLATLAASRITSAFVHRTDICCTRWVWGSHHGTGAFMTRSHGMSRAGAGDLVGAHF